MTPGRRWFPGLSPRVRGNRHCCPGDVGADGSIPACAGEPVLRKPQPDGVSVYPRVCGGTPSSISNPRRRRGLSPRVRGNRRRSPGRLASVRSIPACAGEPFLPDRTCRRIAVYPRVCGGTLLGHPLLVMVVGLSPRVRGNHRPSANLADLDRSIPACAGEPSPAVAFTIPLRVYPRVCGGTTGTSPAAPFNAGLSPRVRGNQYRVTP